MREIKRSSPISAKNAIKVLLHDYYNPLWKYLENHWYFPNFYHSMFHKQSYLLGHWSKFFDIVSYVEGGIMMKQDIVVARKR